MIDWHTVCGHSLPKDLIENLKPIVIDAIYKSDTPFHFFCTQFAFPRLLDQDRLCFWVEGVRGQNLLPKLLTFKKEDMDTYAS